MEFLLGQVVSVAPNSLLGMFQDAFHYLGFFYKTSIYWGPFILPVIFWRVWMKYVRARFIAGQEYILLEIRLPQEVMKSPIAMQAVLDGLWAKGGESTFIDRMWAGKVRMWYSFELVSMEGQVHIYVWARKAFQRMVERSFYAHYPDIEIVPTVDYALTFPFSLESHNLYASDYALSRDTGLPLKTYTEYSLESTSAKEEQKIDPMTHLLEFLGSMGKGEYLWIQILARAHKKEDFTYGAYYNKKTYAELSKSAIDSIRKSPEDATVFADGGKGKVISEEQKQTIKAIQRNVQSSQPWDTGMRVLYIAEHEYFDGTNVSGMMGMWQPFTSPGYNSIAPEGSRGQNSLDYPWQDFNDIRQNKMKIKAVDAYRLRSWFHAPYRYNHFILTSAELATIFHIPGSVAKTPTMQRIESARASAPANLPI
ncbi:MAG: hypothetical protein KBD24_00155 [Candidatus Pacebacteria bacterium]|nr:hypothetical protein [Candidatus Paceibacterota bacterium]